MIEVRVETQISAPIEVCFDLARSQKTHVLTTASTGERIVSGPPRDLLELGDELTFEARHLGRRWRLSARVVSFVSPTSFADEQLSGPFKRLRHEHLFVESEGVTTMTDVIYLAAPLGFLGWIAERVVLGGYMTRFVRKRGLQLKRIAEQGMHS